MNRSEIMKTIKSTDNKSTERRFKFALIRAGVSGWTVQPEMKEGPDLAFIAERVAVFLDGCFWHGCADHFSTPKTNRLAWVKKIRANRQRDARNVAALAAQGWKVFRIWEHDLKDPHVLKGIALRVARAADTPDTCEAYTAPRRDPSPGAEVMACVPCGRMTGHRAKDLTGFGVFKEATCEECGTFTRRINKIALRGGQNANDDAK